MISIKLSDLGKLSEYYIFDSQQPSIENQNLVRIISYLYPAIIFKGYKKELTNDKVFISTKTDFIKLQGENKILHIYNQEKIWGFHCCILRLLQIQEHYGEFIQSTWEKYIELSGRKFYLTHRERLYFIPILKNFRIRRLRKQGIRKFIPILQKTPHHLNRDYRLGMGYVSENSHLFEKDDWRKIEQVYQRLADNQSKKAYRDVIFGDARTIWSNYYDNLIGFPQYMDYVRLDTESVILNFGVDNGFELPYFLAFNVQKIINIDPTGDSLLDQYVREWTSLFDDRLEFIHYAISEKSDRISINDKEYKAIRMDELLRSISLTKLDLIKVDTDGGEDSILDGMDVLIKKFRPQIAFSIYHTNRDFFEMSLRLMEMCPDYNFYCKTYSYERLETILYCIPNEAIKRS